MKPDLSFNQFSNAIQGLSNRLDRLNERTPSGLWRDCTIPYVAGISTPLKASTADPTLGTGSTSFARYCRMGDLVAVFVDIAFGAGATAGTGTYWIQMPFANSASMTGTFGMICSARLQDASTGNVLYTSGATMNTGTTNLVLRYQAAWPIGADTVVTNAAPWAWAASDRITVHVLYEAAPY